MGCSPSSENGGVIETEKVQKKGFGSRPDFSSSKEIEQSLYIGDEIRYLTTREGEKSMGKSLKGGKALKTQ